MLDSRLGARLIAEVRLARWERRIAAAAKRALDVHRAKVLDALRPQPIRASLGFSAAGPPVDPFDEGTWLDTLGRELTPVAHQVFAEMGEVATERLAEVGTVAYPEVDLTHHLDRMVGHMAGLGPDMATRLGTTLGEGFNRGESLYDLDARVRDTFGVGARRAEMIARTETVSAANGVSHDVARSLIDGGIALDKEWLATGDHRTRPSHSRADGQVRPFDQPFEVGGCLLQRPHDPEAFCPGEIVNCRCVLMYPEAEETVSPSLPLRGERAKAALVEAFGEDPYLSLPFNTPAQRAFAEYRGSGYRTINRVLRDDPRIADLPVEEVARIVDEVVAVIDQEMAPVPRTLTVIRDVDTEPVFGVDDPTRLRPGQRFGERGFSSTAVRDEAGSADRGLTRMEIEVPEGTRGYWLSSGEDELLLQRDLTFEVVGWDEERQVLRMKVVR